MQHRRSQGDTKSTNSISSMPTTSNSSTKDRVSIYSMRERVILDKMTRMMGKLAPDTETEVTSRLHQEIPAIRLDGHLIYCLYMTLQNFIHLNAIYILLYHSIFWFDSSKSHLEMIESSRILEQTQFEQTHFLILSTEYYSFIQKSLNTDSINKYIYISLTGISSIELIGAFLWTLKKKLPYLMQRHQKLKYRFNILLIGMIIFVYSGFLTWLLFHTFVTQQIPLILFAAIAGHIILLTCLDKPHLFEQSPYHHSSKPSTTSRKQYHNSTSSSSTSSIVTPNLNRLSYRSSISTQPRKPNAVVNPTTLIPWSRWSSILEEKPEVHECSTFYAQARQEADDLWPIIIRRVILIVYRTIASFILFDFIPLQTINPHVRLKDDEPFKFLFLILALSTFLTQSAFLFPVKLQTTLHRIATHLGHWRQQSNIRTETFNEWSADCNSYTRGSVVKLSSNNQYYIANQHVNNAAHPQSRSHSILYRLFGEATYLLTSQFLLAFILILFHLIWTIRGKHWEQILVSCLIVFSSSYPIFKIVRDRVIMDLVDEHEFVQTFTISKPKKSS